MGIRDYEEISIDGNEMRMRKELFDQTGRWDVPQAFVGDDYIGDDDDLAAEAESGALVRRLSPAY